MFKEHTVLSYQELLREAAKAQLRRLCTVKKKRVNLNVPSWVVQEFKSRPQNETAALLMSCNFDKAGVADVHTHVLFVFAYI